MPVERDSQRKLWWWCMLERNRCQQQVNNMGTQKSKSEIWWSSDSEPLNVATCWRYAFCWLTNSYLEVNIKVLWFTTCEGVNIKGLLNNRVWVQPTWNKPSELGAVWYRAPFGSNKIWPQGKHIWGCKFVPGGFPCFFPGMQSEHRYVYLLIFLLWWEGGRV